MDEAKTIEEIAEGRNRIKGELSKVIVGQEGVVDLLLIALFCRGHCLFIGVPGLAKDLIGKHPCFYIKPKV